jgi:hypothetical protein
MTAYATLPTTAAAASPSKARSARLAAAARILMGLVFFLFGLFGVLNAVGVIPLPRPSTALSEGAAAFTAAIMKTGYMFPLVKCTECIAGALLLSNRFVPLALAIIAPVVVNIVAYHAFLQPSGLILAAVILLLEIYLAWTYRRAYRPMLEMRP